MSQLETGVYLFQYSILVFVLGMVTPMLLRLRDQGWPKPRKRWAYPLLLTSVGMLAVSAISYFVILI